jgi:hypothetical protein
MANGGFVIVTSFSSHHIVVGHPNIEEIHPVVFKGVPQHQPLVLAFPEKLSNNRDAFINDSLAVQMGM